MITNQLTKHYQTSLEVLEKDIDDAFNQSLFEIYYQPQISLKNRQLIIGTEACVRLNHQQHGILAASLFIPLIQKKNRSLKLFEIVASQVVKDWIAWKNQGYDLQVAVNLELDLFKDEEFYRVISKIIDRDDFNNSRLTLEISVPNSQLLSDAICEQIFKVKLKGVKFSLNNFTSESFTFDDLQRCPIDQLKICGNLITDILINPKAQVLVEQILDKAEQLNIPTTAVCIESKDEAEWLEVRGCFAGQGYLFGKPLSEREFYRCFLSREDHWEIQKAWDKPEILVVDPDENYQNLFIETLSELFTVHTAYNQQQALEAFQLFQPEVIICETQLENSSGVELCKELSSLSNYQNCSIMFVSKDDTTNNRLAAYEANALDYILKPFFVTELIAKICRITVLQKKPQELATNVKEIEKTAELSIREASLYGSLINFFRNLMQCNDEDQLKAELFSFMKQKDLQCSIQFRNTDAIKTFDQNNHANSPIELNVFELLQSKGRLYEFGQRLMINYEHVSCLIKNMPTDKAEAGAARDYLAIIIEGIEFRYVDILRQRTLMSVLNKLKHLASGLSDAIKVELKDKKDLMEKLEVELNMSFHILDLTMEQEQYITDIVENMIEAKSDSELTSLNAIDSIEEVIQVLSKNVKDLKSDPKKEERPPETADVELF